MTNNSDYYLIIDQGTSSTKAFLFDANNCVVQTNRIRHTLLHPAPKHVESDPIDILYACFTLILNALKYTTKTKGRIVSIGLAVQRSTFLFWDKKTKKAITPAISWQDTRAWKESDEFSEYRSEIWELTGAPLSPHFGGPKFLHFIRKDPTLKHMVDSGKVWFGPLSAFLTHALTGKCAIDESIACRTLLYDIHSASWSSYLMDLFEVPECCLPPVLPTTGDFGCVELDHAKIPLNCVIGDQQAALIGQGGSEPETFAINLGTSGSVQFNTGNRVKSTSGLLSSVLFSTNTDRFFMLEGTINACNSLFYRLEEEMNIPHKDMRWNDRCLKTSTGGVFVYGDAGLAAPYWKDRFSTIEIDLDNVSADERIRAAMESIGFLIFDIVQSMKGSMKKSPPIITISGGGARSALLQFLADLLNISIGHTTMTDRTALGVNLLLRYYQNGQIPVTNIECEKVFSSKITAEKRKEKLVRWHKAIRSILD